MLRSNAGAAVTKGLHSLRGQVVELIGSVAALLCMGPVYDVAMTNILYGSQYLYRFGSGSNFVGYDTAPMHWAMLTDSSILNIWFEKEGGTTAGDSVNVGDIVYLATNLSTGVLGRYLITDTRDYLRWDIIAGQVRGAWIVYSPGLEPGQPIPIYSNVSFYLASAGTGPGWLAQEPEKNYLQLNSEQTSALVLASTDT